MNPDVPSKRSSCVNSWALPLLVCIYRVLAKAIYHNNMHQVFTHLLRPLLCTTELGQALSIRTDLIPEAYALSLRQLQDAVPPFSSEEAYDILRREFGVDDLSRVFSSLSDKPVASASIGQVYRGVLAANGKEVAVKVQVSTISHA